MFKSHQKFTGTSYTAMVACVAAAILSPAVWIALRPFGTATVLLSLTTSGVCLALAWIAWKWASRPWISSLAVQRGVAK